ncbi:hypothetical protein [Sphingomicrobium arenosum]|uniref:hypothetical protein n=1 Tax=Sphingomicrobium arenosum TaxID=2233861 RepID=UPI00223ED3F4|nr:hypothetical protein [Sphingomicrobium arenosum]
MGETLPTEPITLEARTLSDHPRWQLPLALASLPLLAWLSGLMGAPPVQDLILWALLLLPVAVMTAIALLLRPSGRKLGLRIDGDGLFYPAFHRDPIEWRNVEDVRAFGAGEGEAVLFALHDPPQGGGSKPVGLSRIFGFGSFGIRTDDLDCSIEAVEAAALRNFKLASRAGRFKPREKKVEGTVRGRTAGFGKGRGLRL